MHNDEPQPKPYKVIRDIVHDWKIEEVSGPGHKFFWICRRCGSFGGPSPLPWEELEVKKPSVVLFLAGTPLFGLPEDDCDAARRMIDEYVAKYPEWKEYADRARRAG